MNLAVIFDMDGVLIDSESFYFERRINFFIENNLTPGSLNKLDYVGKTDYGIWKTLVPENEGKRAQLKKAYSTYRKNHPIDFTKALRNGVKELLAELKSDNIKIALASSSPRCEIDEMLAQNQLSMYFDFVISGEELTESKPHPQIYVISEKELQCARAFAVEDSPLGIASAKAAGLYTIALKQEYPLDQRKADTIITDLLELKDIIKHSK